MKVPTERLREMLAACEGVTPGPWEADFLEILHVDRKAGGWRKMATIVDDEAASDFPIATAEVGALDKSALEAARKAIRYLSHPETPWSDEQVAAVINAYLAVAPSPPIGDTGGVVGYVDRLSNPTRISATEAPGLEMPVFAAALVPARVEAVDHIADAGKKVDGWQPIETAPMDRTAVLIAVPDKDRTGFIVGEAYFDPENYEGGDWWWAGTGWGDYPGGPVSEVNHHPPTHWRPLPAPPALQANPS